MKTNHNRIDLKTHKNDFKDKHLSFSVSSRGIRHDINIIDYLKVFYIYCDLNSIDSIFGSTLFKSKLYGGRALSPINGLTDIHLQDMKKHNIGLALTLSNHFFDKISYRESWELLEKHHVSGNSIICTNDELAINLKKDFPLYEIKASIIKKIDTLDKIKYALEIYNSLTLPMDKNDDDEFLNSLLEKDRIILFGNATCAYNCPSRTCYLEYSQQNYGKKITAECSDKKVSRLDFGYIHFNIKKFKEMGFSSFKLVPMVQQGSVKVARFFSNKKSYFFNIIKKNKKLFYLCSYPKCGRTWLRYIFANYINIIYKLDIDINLPSFFSLMPNDDNGPKKGINAYKFVDDKRFPLLISSHFKYRKNKFKDASIIFMLRAIPDVIVSDYFHNTRILKSYQGDLKSFIRDPQGGLFQYCHYINSWASQLGGKKTMILTYEMMHKDISNSIENILTFLNIPINKEYLKKAVQLSSFENMQKAEKKKGIPGLDKKYHDPEARRVRKGKVNGSKEYLDNEDLFYISNTCESLLSIESENLLKTYRIGV